MVEPIKPFLVHQDALILDGGLATELEVLGCDLSDALWSARLLMDDPDLIRQVHLSYFNAGADCAISASYQASIPGFMAKGVSRTRSEELIRLSVRLAIEARDEFWDNELNRHGRLRPIVAASVGPYGAFLADGSEYSGQYRLDEQELYEWHRERWHLLSDGGADLLACETIPSYQEMRALCRLLDETPGTPAWFSFSCRDGERINDGTNLANCARSLAGRSQVVAIGINCTPPRYVTSLIRHIRQVTDKPLVVYPNSGETYDAENKRWVGESNASEFGTFSREWRKEGAALIGGCCRTGPDHIRQIADRMRRRRTAG